MKKLIVSAILLLALALPAQVINEAWRPDEGPVCYAVPILDYSTMTAKEMAIHYFTNLARMGYDCGTPMLECGSSGTLPLFALDFKLSTAARWFSKHLNDTPCFQHDTCCTLTLAGDEVQCVSGTACTNQPCDKTACAGTSWVERIAMFGANPTGENLAAGNELAVSTLCQWMNSPGHRDNICLPSHSSLGTGYHGGQNCFYHYWTQDFGGGMQTGRLYPGALFIDGTLTAGIVVKTPSAVETATVVIDDAPTPLANTFGTAIRGAWSAAVSAADCAAYYFTVSFADNNTERFPPTGYLFNSENPAECEAPDGDPDIDTAQPDDTTPDNAVTDTDDTTGDDGTTTDGTVPDEEADDHTIPYDYNPGDNDYTPADNDTVPVDYDFFWPPDSDKPAEGGCSCAIIL